ncbi:MAG: ribonuclease activity regulator RraA [Thermomicrobiales bacterium]
MEFDRVDPAILESLRQVSTATLSGVLAKRGIARAWMQDVAPLRPDLRLAGQAFTLRYIPMREDLERSQDFDNRTNKQRIAVESVGPGDVLVIDARGDTRAATLGHILATRISVRGAAGIVTDGSYRDSPGIRTLELPTYARGQSPDISFAIHHPSELNVPIACGGVAVLPGDLIAGDGEGVIVIPLALAQEVTSAALDQEHKEEFILAKIERGASILGVYPPDEKTLREYEEWKLEAAP